MVKITNDFGDIKQGCQDTAIYQLHYGQQIRRVKERKRPPPSQMQTNQRTRFQQAISWRSSLSLTARRYLEGYAISHRVIDSYGIPLSWDKMALKIALEIPKLKILS